MAEVQIRYWAAARSAAGRSEETVEAEHCGQAWAEVSARAAGTPLEPVLRASSLLVDGVRRDRDDLAGIAAPAVVEVLPPFAGG